ncbi:MAG: anaerobic ribonucleoside-triphosphate reductase, partial [Candidatus Bathyarchaeia archaeon]
MSSQFRMKGIKVLKAISATVRLQILNLLYDRGSLSYTELMNLLKMSPSRDAGRFAYHLKFLLKADLIEADVESKKYRLTDLGRVVIGVADEIERKGLKPEKMLVRTSRFTLEEFDSAKIAESLIKEAGTPTDLAQKVAKEAEKRLIKARTKYLTAPLIREVVNAILVEKGLEEYRHRLTRLGLPVHDVTSILSEIEALHGAAFICEAAGKNVLEEYTLLNVLPRDVADAHLSGALHLHSLGCWILKPSEVWHDLRFFIRNGLNFENFNFFNPSHPPPQDLRSALNLIFTALLHFAGEVDQNQTMEYFNVFLSPFVKDVEKTKIKEELRTFIMNISRFTNSSIGLELTLPDFLAEKAAVGASDNHATYENFAEESLLLASLTIEILSEETVEKPLLSPKVVVKIRPDSFHNEKAKEILLKAHAAACEGANIYFANLFNDRYSVFSSTGCFLNADVQGDWETDTLRAGIMGCVTANLPQIAYECGKNKARFFETLGKRLELASSALEVKSRSLKHGGKALLPRLMHFSSGDQYFRAENSAFLINIAGLKECAEAYYGKRLNEDGNVAIFALEIAKYLSDLAFKGERRREKRLLFSVLPYPEAMERLARQDIERYGVGRVRFQG